MSQEELNCNFYMLLLWRMRRHWGHMGGEISVIRFIFDYAYRYIAIYAYDRSRLKLRFVPLPLFLFFRLVFWVLARNQLGASLNFGCEVIAEWIKVQRGSKRLEFGLNLHFSSTFSSWAQPFSIFFS